MLGPLLFEDFMSINYDCAQAGLIIIIENVTCNCSSVNHKQAICDIILRMNDDEFICKERRRFNNPNIPPYQWSISPLLNGISIVDDGVVAVNIYCSSADLPTINHIFQHQIDSGVAWCNQYQ